MDQDLDLTQEQSPEQVPQVPSTEFLAEQISQLQQKVSQSEPQLQFSTDEIFNILFEKEKLTWTEVMAQVVEWAETSQTDLSEKFPSFNNFISNFYTEKYNRLQK